MSLNSPASTHRQTRSGSSGSINFNDFKKLLKESEDRILNTVMDRLDNISNQLNDMKEAIRNIKTVQQKHEGEIEKVKEYIFESEKRKLHDVRRELSANIIMYGIPETPDSHQDDDDQKVQEIVDIVTDGEYSIDTPSIRIGRKFHNKSRPIKITTKSRADRNKLLQKAREKRNHPNLKDIYLDSDKCYADRKEMMRLKGKLKALREQNPNKNCYISRGKLFVEHQEVDQENPLQHILPSF